MINSNRRIIHEQEEQEPGAHHADLYHWVVTSQEPGRLVQAGVEGDCLHQDSGALGGDGHD